MGYARNFLGSLLLSLPICGLAQDDAEAPMQLGVNFSWAQVQPRYSALTLSYTDQASTPHYINKDFTLNRNALFGVDVNLLGYTTKKKIFIDGLGVSYHGAKHNILFNIFSGFGYVFQANKKIKIIPKVNIGYGFYGYLIGKFPFDGHYLVINGQNIRGDYTVNLMHNSFYTMPRISFRYALIEDMDINFTVGYKWDMIQSENISFAETLNTYTANRTAHTRPKHGILHNNQILDNNFYSFNGLNLNIGVVFTF